MEIDPKYPHETWYVRQEDADNPEWEKAGLVHDWRNYVGRRTREIWHTFTPSQRLVLANDADCLAINEDWD